MLFCHWTDPSRLSRKCPPNRVSITGSCNAGFGDLQVYLRLGVSVHARAPATCPVSHLHRPGRGPGTVASLSKGKPRICLVTCTNLLGNIDEKRRRRRLLPFSSVFFHLGAHDWRRWFLGYQSDPGGDYHCTGIQSKRRVGFIAPLPVETSAGASMKTFTADRIRPWSLGVWHKGQLLRRSLRGVASTARHSDRMGSQRATPCAIDFFLTAHAAPPKRYSSRYSCATKSATKRPGLPCSCDLSKTASRIAGI